ncbi:MAG TPA: ribosome biogenesis GTPase Der, partial [Dongiaceae bacterium]
PTFNLFCNIPEAMPNSYLRYLVNGLRQDFELPGVPIRVVLKRSDNPYAGKRKKA